MISFPLFLPMPPRYASFVMLLLLGLVANAQVAVEVEGTTDEPVSTVAQRRDISEHVFYDVNWVLDAGTFYAQVDSEIRVDDSNGNIGTYIDLEDDLNLSEAELLFDVALGYHGWEHWSLEFEWFELNRNSSGVLAKDIYWNHSILPVGAEFDFYFDVEVYRVLLGYEVWSSPHSVLGLGFGNSWHRDANGNQCVR